MKSTKFRIPPRNKRHDAIHREHRVAHHHTEKRRLGSRVLEARVSSCTQFVCVSVSAFDYT